MNDLHPFDFEALNPGDVLTVEQLELFTGYKKGSDAYRYSVLALKSRIIKERDEIGRPIEIKQVRGELKICNAAEQLRLSENRSREAGRKFKRAYEILGKVKVDELDESQLKKFDSALLNTGAKIAAISRNSIKRLVSCPKKLAS